MRPASSNTVDEYRVGGRWEGVWHKKQTYCHAVTFISDIGIGYRVRPHVDIGYRHFPKFTYRLTLVDKPINQHPLVFSALTLLAGHHEKHSARKNE